MSTKKQVSSKVLFNKLKKHLQAARQIRRDLAGPPDHMLMSDTYPALANMRGSLEQAEECLKEAFKSEGMLFKQKP